MRKHNQSGFTLIELLVVVAIIGILAAIAIPQFAAYRAKGFDARAESDCRNAATAEEAYFVDNATYSSTTRGAPGLRAVGGRHRRAGAVPTPTSPSPATRPRVRRASRASGPAIRTTGQPNMDCTP